MHLQKPKKLNPGDTIGIVASSLPLLPSFQENYQRGIKVLQDLGFKIHEGETLKMQKGWMAGTPREVARDINVMFADSNIKAIISQTGGYSAISILEHIDFELIEKNPKPFIGFSNTTNFHLALYEKCGLVGFHMGDLTFGLGNENEAASGFDKQMLEKFLMSSEKPGIISPMTEWEVWKEGKAKGTLIGGNLLNMSLLVGSEYFPSLDKFKGSILFWEEVMELKVDVWARLFQLKYLGVLEKISGMLIGKIKSKKMREVEIEEPTLKEAVLEVCKDYDFPIMAGLDFGHYSMNIPMPVGIEVEFDTSNLELDFLENNVA